MTSRRALFLATATTVIIALLHLAECTSIAGNPHAKGGGGGSTAVRIHQQHLDPFLHGDVGGGGGSGLPSSSSSSSSAGHSYQKMRHPNDIMATLNSLMSPNRIGKKRKRFSLKDFSFGETKAFARKSIPRSSSGQGQQLVVGTGKGEKKRSSGPPPTPSLRFLAVPERGEGGKREGNKIGSFFVEPPSLPTFLSGSGEGGADASKQEARPSPPTQAKKETPISSFSVPCTSDFSKVYSPCFPHLPLFRRTYSNMGIIKYVQIVRILN